HGRMILESVENGPLFWSTVEENRVTRPKKYSELSAMKAIQADCDYASQVQSSTPLSITYLSNDFQSSVNHNVYNPSSSVPQVEYAIAVHQQFDFSQPESGLVVLVFQKGDDPIYVINHMMSFLIAVVTSRYPPTNKQPRTSLNPHQQATINNERVTIQPIPGRQNSLTVGMSRQYTSGPSGTNLGKQRVIVCYKCKGEGHMSKQCTKPKRIRDDAWFKDKIALMANLSYYGSDNLVEVHNQDNVANNVIDQDVQAISTSEQSNILNQLETKIITSASCAQSLEIENLKHTLSEHLKEKESLEQKVTLLKNDFHKDESQNIDRELALEKHVKELNNIMIKRNQSTHTAHMLTKP
nr:hypothetical protein [Tanacetum cinerariifolium]